MIFLTRNGPIKLAHWQEGLRSGIPSSPMRESRRFRSVPTRISRSTGQASRRARIPFIYFSKPTVPP
jgi:hypothetical protein